MNPIVRGVISLIIGIVICVLQATGQYHNGGTNGYLIGGIIIAFGLFRIARGANRQ